MTASGFNDELRTLAVTGWQETAQSIQVPELPFDLHVTIGQEPACVDLTEAGDSSETVFIRLRSSSTVRFREEGVEVTGQHLQNPIILIETVRPGAKIMVGREDLLIGTGTGSKTCKHGIAPPSKCSCPNCSKTG